MAQKTSKVIGRNAMDRIPQMMSQFWMLKPSFVNTKAEEVNENDPHVIGMVVNVITDNVNSLVRTGDVVRVNNAIDIPLDDEEWSNMDITRKPFTDADAAYAKWEEMTKLALAEATARRDALTGLVDLLDHNLTEKLR
jgi:hypothetical protein